MNRHPSHRVAVLHDLKVLREELLLRAQREDRLDASERLFRHSVGVLTLHHHALVEHTSLLSEEVRADEDERGDQERQDSELPALYLILSKECDYANETDDNTGNETRNGVE